MSVPLDGDDDAGKSGADQVADATASTDANAAGSSAAEQGAAQAEPKGADFDPLAVTRQALEAPAEKPAEGDGATPGSDAKDGDKSEAKDKAAGDAEPKDEAAEDANLPFSKHPRFRRVIQERNEARRQLAELEPDAQRFREVASFMESSRLEPQEVQNGFAIMAAMRNDPAKAWDLLRPYVEGLHTVLGLTLPDDLRRKVDDGVMDEASATEVARVRGGEAAERTRREVAERQDRERRESEASAARVNAANAFVEEQRTKDPDFALIEPLLDGAIQAAIRRRQQSGQPLVTPDHVRETVAAAYADVRTHLRRVAAPRPGPVRGVPSGMSSASPATPAPKNAIEVTRAALGLAG